MNLLNLEPSLYNLAMSINESHIWLADLDQSTDLIDNFKPLLSEDEILRAEEYSFEKDRNRYIIRTGILKSILGRYLDISPNIVQFNIGKNGKPHLCKVSGQIDINFNISYSEEITVFAFTRNQEIGIDIEKIQNFPEIDTIVNRFFSIEEKIVLNSLSNSKKTHAFFKLWTCKEALIKAMGTGLSQSIKHVNLLIDSNINSTQYSFNEQSNWQIRVLNVLLEFSVAVATETVKDNKIIIYGYKTWNE